MKGLKLGTCNLKRVTDLAGRWVDGMPTQKTFASLKKAVGRCEEADIQEVARQIYRDNLEETEKCVSLRAGRGKICLQNLQDFLGKNKKVDVFIREFAGLNLDLGHSVGWLFTSPIITMDSNTEAWHSLTQSVASLYKMIGAESGLAQSVEGRSLLGLLMLQQEWMFTYYSHEVAHSQQDVYRGETWPGHLDFFDWWHLAPNWIHNRDTVLTNRYEVELDGIHGLNQQEFNSQYQFRQNSLTGRFTVDEGVAYVFNTFADVAYQVAFPETGDINGFLKHSTFNRAAVSRGELAFWSLSTALASYHSWESAKLFIDYLARGNTRQREMAHLREGIYDLLPPSFSLFLNPFGLYANAELPVRNFPARGATTFFELGGGVAGALSLFRLGGEIDRLGFGGGEWYVPSVDLFGHINFNTLDATALLGATTDREISGDVEIIRPIKLPPMTTGFELGGRIRFGEDPFHVALTLRYADNDFIENAVKGKPAGFDLGLSLNWRYDQP